MKHRRTSHALGIGLLGGLLLFAGCRQPSTPSTPASKETSHAGRYAGGDPSARYALLVGIGDYPGTRNDLNSPVADARIMQDVLVNTFGYDPDHLVLLLDEEADREHIIDAFQRHLGQAGPEGTALFFYSGHGMQLGENRGLTVYFQHSGGAIGRIAAEATAFPHRKSIASMFVATTWPENAEPTEHIDYTRSYWKTIETFTDGYYTNDTGDEPQPMINANYQVNYERLLQLKNKYDPGTLFRLNANIKPSV